MARQSQLYFQTISFIVRNVWNNKRYCVKTQVCFTGHLFVYSCITMGCLALGMQNILSERIIHVVCMHIGTTYFHNVHNCERYAANTNFHYNSHNRKPHDSIHKEVYPVHICKRYFFKLYFNIISLSTPMSSKWFPAQYFVHSHLPSACHMHAQLIRLGFTTLTIFG